ncbi:MAG: hypothetical protein LBE78_06550 [Burkholderiaceae bacterium]|nr:hypothetical protein [Burkholderiaceae bacterium]
MQTFQRLFSSIATIGAAAMLAGCVYYPAHQPYSAAPREYPTQEYPNQPGYVLYGHVVNVEYLRSSGSRSSGAGGAVVGGVVGGLAGNQIGRGFSGHHGRHHGRGGGGGRALATAVGVIGGALIGSAIDRDMNRVAVDFYRVTVQFDDSGGVRSFDYAQPPNVRVGDRVWLQGEHLYR